MPDFITSKQKCTKNYSVIDGNKEHGIKNSMIKTAKIIKPCYCIDVTISQ